MPRSKVQPYKDINKDGKLTRWEIAKFVHDELQKQGETVKMSEEEEQEMISEILKVEGNLTEILFFQIEILLIKLTGKKTKTATAMFRVQSLPVLHIPSFRSPV